MPQQNDALLTALTHANHTAALSTPAGIAALNVLLKAGTTPPPDAFRKAIIDHRVFWRTVGLAIQDNENPADDGFLAAAGHGVGAANNNPAALLMQATEKRVTLGLKNAADPLLLSIINAPNHSARRQQLAGADAAGKLAIGDLAIPNWNHAQQNIIDNPAADRILLEAKHTLLLRKIEACTSADIANLGRLLGGDPGYSQATAALGVPNMGPADGSAELRNAAAKKGLSLEIKAITSADVLGHGFATLNEANAGNFRGCFPRSAFAGHLDAGDIDAIKGQLGARFLDLTIASSPRLTKVELSTIAATADPALLAGFLKTNNVFTNAAGGAYIDHAVTPQTLASLRQTAATRALKQSIDTCDDLPTLEALIAAKTPDHIKDVLASSDSLGFKGNNAFRDAFTATTATAAVINDIVAAAHVRKSLSIAKDPDHLKDLIDDASFQIKYDQHFAVGASPALKGALTTYFTPENRKKAREEALIGYAKAKLADVNLMKGPDLNGLVRAGGALQVLTGAKILLGLGVADNTADDLITAHNSGVGRQLRAYAAAEQLVRDTKALDLGPGGQYATLTGSINDLASNDVAAHQRALIGTLPPKDKHALQARLAEVLASNYKVGGPNSLIKLTNLAKAENLTDFQSALSALGVDDHAWTDDKSRVPVQKAACLSAIKLKIIEVSQFDAQAHPALATVISSLSLEKQKVLLDKPEILKALVRARNADEVKKIVGDNSINADPLIAENKKLALIAKIQNAEVAKTLASVQPPLPLTVQDIDNINTLVRAPGFAGNYVVDVNAIAAYTGPNRVGVFQAFGLNNTGNAIADAGAKQNLIQPQKQHNNLLETLALDPNNNLTLSEKAVLNLCLSLDKGGVLTAPAAPAAVVAPTVRAPLAASEFTDFFDDFQAAESAEQFIKTAKGTPPTIPAKSYYAHLNPASFEKQLTPEAFKEVKRTLNQQKVLGSASYTGFLAAQKTRMKAMADILNDIQNKDTAIADKLESLSKVKAIEWLNPAFQAAAKQNAHKMAAHFKVLAEGCDVLVTQYQHQRDALIEEYKGLPTKTQIRNLPVDPLNPTSAEKKQMDAIYKRREELSEQFREVITALDSYESVQRTLNGHPNRQNPLLQKGILKTLEEIKEGKKDIEFLPFNSFTKDYPMSKIGDHLKKGHQGASAPSVPTTVSAGGGTYYRTVDLVKEGEFREHTIPYTGSSGQTIHSHFIEERDPTKNLKAVVGDKGEVIFLPSIKLTASQFPSGGPPAITDAELIEAKVAYSIAIASQALAGLSSAPNADNQIIIRGSNPEEVKHLWSAFVAIGKSDPNMKFDESAIKVISTAFHPEDEKSKWYGFKDSSYYSKYYEKNPNLADLTAGIREVNENKVKNSRSMIEDTKVVSEFFKDELKQTLDNVKQKNEQDGTTPTLGT